MRLVRRRTEKKETIKQAYELDGITNSFQLAFALMNMESRQEERKYLSHARLSSIESFCPREGLLGYRNGEKKVSRTGIALQATFDIGDAVHSFVQNSPKYLGDRRRGWWRCLACGYVYFGMPRRKPCPKCNAHHNAFLYQEHSMKLDDPKVTGHPDMLYALTMEEIRVLELKTLNGDEFKALERPKAEHVFQVIGYMHYLPKDKTLPIKINPNKGLIWYFSKQMTKASLPFKAFHISKDAITVRALETTLEQFTRGIQEADYLPEPLAACRQSGWKTYRARSCPLTELCQECG